MINKKGEVRLKLTSVNEVYMNSTRVQSTMVLLAVVSFETVLFRTGSQNRNKNALKYREVNSKILILVQE